ncbi:MAG: PAS domain S-box protein, partial [Chloroflexota bacterium]
AAGKVTGLVGISRDITERKRAVEALAASEQRFSLLVAGVRDYAIYGLDCDGNVTSWNAGAEHIKSYTTGEILGQNFACFYTPESRAHGEPQHNLESARNEGQFLSEGWRVRKDGSQFWAEVLITALYDPQNRLIGFSKVTRDLSERKRIEDDLRENEAKLQTFFEVLPVGVTVLNYEGQIVEINPALERILGMSMPGISTGAYQTRAYIDRDGRPMPRSEFPSVRAGVEQKIIHDVVIGVLKEDQTTVWTSVSAAPLPGSNAGVITVTADITEQKRGQDALQESEERFRQLMEHLQVAFWMIPPNGQTFLYMSPAYETIMGRSCESLYRNASSFLEAIHPDDQERVRQIRLAALPSGRYEAEFRVLRPDGTVRWVFSQAFPIEDDQEKVYRIAGITEDITERKQTEGQAFALAAERQRVTLLHDFITDVSHDLRTPLTIIGTSATLLSRTTDPVKLAERGRLIETQVSRLGLLLDSFVELAQLEQVAASTQVQPTSLDRLTKAIIEQSKQLLADKNQLLNYQCDSSSLVVLGDGGALAKAVTQVVTNAIDYTPEGGQITLHLSSEGDQAVIEVADTGMGIPADKLPHIFESFYRVDSARSTESGGAGLGLSMAKKVVELMGGRIEVQSEIGVGSVFRIYLLLHDQ